MRRTFLIGALLGVLLDGTHGSAQSPASEASLATTLGAVLDQRAIAGARVAVMVAAADSGRVLFAASEDLAMNPASNAKLLTAAAALSILGPSRAFETTVWGRLEGDAVSSLALRGGGDPALRARDLDALAAELASRGVTRVTGGLLLDDTLYGGESLPPGFEQQPGEDAAYRPSVSALAVDAAAITVTVRADPRAPRCVATASPPESAVVVSAAEVHESAAPVLRVAPLADGRARIEVGGRCAARPSVVARRQLHPTAVAGAVFRRALSRYGITVDGDDRVGATPGGLEQLAIHRSQPLSALLYEAGKHSNNFTAEMIFLATGGGPRGFASAAERVRAWASSQGVPTLGMQVRNGSGLYDSDRLSARQLVHVLRAAWGNPALRHEFVAQLATAGEDGTLARRLSARPARGVVRAKTGTLNDVIALSGYALGPTPARTLVFSVLINGARGHTQEARRLVDELALAIARWNPARR
ncbi:MAG: D-alanyl-D-alanine carboxypeptidase/D-alanyl-D-alanine-endopeptidase [Polyangiales bacterium]